MNKYYAALPNKVKALGTMKFATYPPEDLDTLVGRLYDKHMSKSWRKNAIEYKAKLFEPVPQDKKLLEKLHEKKKPYTGPLVSSDQVDSMTISRMVAVRRGNWRILPEGIENKKTT
jgi:muramidase (phage lysozyme)